MRSRARLVRRALRACGTVGVWDGLQDLGPVGLGLKNVLFPQRHRGEVVVHDPVGTPAPAPVAHGYPAWCSVRERTPSGSRGATRARARTRLLQRRMQRVGQTDFLGLLVAAFDDVEILGHCRTALVGEFAGALVTHPAVHATATTVDPQQVLKAKVLCCPDRSSVGARGGAASERGAITGSCAVPHGASKHVTAQRCIEDLDRDCHVLPALCANVGVADDGARARSWGVARQRPAGMRAEHAQGYAAAAASAYRQHVRTSS